MTALNAQNIPPDMSGLLPGPYFELADRPSLVRIAKGKTWTDAAEIFLVGRGQACPRGTWGVPRGGQFSLRTKS